MKGDRLDVVRGSGNVYRDLRHEEADVEQFKAILAAEIIKELDRQGLSVRAAHNRTGIAATDFSSIRNADVGRFTVDRLISIIKRLGSRIELRIKLRPAEPGAYIKNLDRASQRRTRETKDYDASDTASFVGDSEPLKFEDLGLKLPEVPPTQVVSIRLPSNLLNELKALSSERDIPYESLIKLFLSQSVSRFKKRSTS